MRSLSILLAACLTGGCGSTPQQAAAQTESKPPILAVTPSEVGPAPGAKTFAFDEKMLPSLADINGGRFKKLMEGKRYLLTNVHASFDRVFTLIHDEGRDVYIIQDKNGRTLFEGRFDGVPRYAASLDLDADGEFDVLLDVAAYGNHGNGSEIYSVLLNTQGHLTPLQNPIHTDDVGGQSNRAGDLTWYSDTRVCAIFVGEEAQIGEDAGTIQVGAIQSIKEVWGHKDGAMVLISKSSTAIEKENVRRLTFR